VTAGTVRIDGGGGDSPETGILSRTEGTDPAGPLIFTADDLQVLAGGRISSVTTAAGAGGNVTVRADTITVDGGTFDRFTGIAANAEGGDVGGAAGTLSVTGRSRPRAASVSVIRGGGISSDTFSAGDAGAVSVFADELVIAGGGVAVETGLDSFTRGTGAGGTVRVEAGNVRITDGGSIQVDAFSSGNAGRIEMVADTVLLDRAGSVLQTGISAQSERQASGAGGRVQLGTTEAPLQSLRVTNAAQLTSTTLNAAPGGEVVVFAHEVVLDAGGIIESASDATVAPAGRSGDVSVTVSDGGAVRLENGGRISTRSLAGDAGSITIAAPAGLFMLGGEITTAAAGSGGDVKVTSAGDVVLSDSRITTSAGLDGGNIDIDPRVMLLTRAQLIAQAKLLSGGNITVRSTAFVSSADSVVDASSEQSTAGAVAIIGQELDLSATLVRLPGDFASGASLVPTCAARAGGGTVSSFVTTGRGGAPITPGGWQPELSLPETFPRPGTSKR
jgi:hypothetical protein